MSFTYLKFDKRIFYDSQLKYLNDDESKIFRLDKEQFEAKFHQLLNKNMLSDDFTLNVNNVNLYDYFVFDDDVYIKMNSNISIILSSIQFKKEFGFNIINKVLEFIREEKINSLLK